MKLSSEDYWQQHLAREVLRKARESTIDEMPDRMYALECYVRRLEARIVELEGAVQP